VTVAEPGTVAVPYMNWRPPVVWTAVVAMVEPDHLLVRDVGGGAVLLPGGPVLDGLTPVQAAQAALSGPGNGGLALRPMLIDERQLARRKVIVHTFASAPIPRPVAAELSVTDGRSVPQIISRVRALRLLPARARLRAHFALAAPEIKDTAYVEWRAWLRPERLLGVPVDWPPVALAERSLIEAKMS
jgi:hypothetical protein